MKKFSPYNNSLENFVYLVEKKLTHLEHIEDAIFDDGFAGGIEALRMMNGIINTLQGNSKKGVNVQSKVDGSPSIIAGTNPENDKFFVATKALFKSLSPQLDNAKLFIVIALLFVEVIVVLILLSPKLVKLTSMES